jgi:cysteine desulfurase
MQQRVCFDHLSGTPVAPEVMAAMAPWFSERFGGTGAVHAGGVEARNALDAAREKVAAFVNAASEEEILFTSSGTESLNLALKGCTLAAMGRGNKIVVSAIEHPAILQSKEFLNGLGFEFIKVGVSREGKIDPAAIGAAVDERTVLICVHAGHHDVGTIQDLRALGDVADAKATPLLVDATYAAGWMSLDVQAINASYLAIAPHRFGGPKGVGVLYKRRRAPLKPLLHGGAQELGWRAGTENIPGIVGAGVACELAARTLEQRVTQARELQRAMWEGLKARVTEIRLNGAEVGEGRLPNSLNFSVAGVEGEGLALNLDLKGFAITAGQACATKASKVPAVLDALGVEEKFGPGAVILSFGPENTLAEVERFLDVFPGVVQRLREMG